MKKYIIFSLISLPVFCAEMQLTGQPFLRINEETSTYETSYKSYISPDGKTIIKLIGMEHSALPKFYEMVADMTAGTVVLYELVGHSLADEKKQYDRIALLGNDYSNKWKAAKKVGYPDALGCVYQLAVLSYEGCAKLVHADNHTFDVNAFINQSDDKIKQIVDAKTRQLLIEYGVPYGVLAEIIEESELNKYLRLLPALSACRTSEKELSNKIRHDTKEALLDLDLVHSGKPPIGYLIKKFGTRWEEILLDRNEIIFQLLRNFWSQSQVPAHISIPYGAGHLLFVENFLLKNGHQFIPGSDGWLVAAKLSPLTAETGVNATCVKKVYLSADGLMKIYLIGSLEDDQFSANDLCFVRSRIFSWEESSDGQLVEIAYTPDDMGYIEKNLFRSRFVLTSEAPFVRKNNKKRHCLCRGGVGILGGNFEIAIGNDF